MTSFRNAHGPKFNTIFFCIPLYICQSEVVTLILHLNIEQCQYNDCVLYNNSFIDSVNMIFPCICTICYLIHTQHSTYTRSKETIYNHSYHIWWLAQFYNQPLSSFDLTR
jgi:hypothetical protein